MEEPDGAVAEPVAQIGAENRGAGGETEPTSAISGPVQKRGRFGEFRSPLRRAGSTLVASTKQEAAPGDGLPQKENIPPAPLVPATQCRTAFRSPLEPLRAQGGLGESADEFGATRGVDTETPVSRGQGNQEIEAGLHAAAQRRSFQSPFLGKKSPAGGSGQPAEVHEDQYYSALYRKRSTRKHKGPCSDGVLIVDSRSRCSLLDMAGKALARATSVKGCQNMPEGATLELGTFEVEVVARLSKQEFLSGSVFLQTEAPSEPMALPSLRKKQTIARPRGNAMPPSPRYDPEAFGAEVLNYEAYQNGAEVAVVLDPYVSGKLRPHQKTGVQFMYNCVMGVSRQGFNGCILADDMGLGKSLQVLALISTLAKQGPKGVPVAPKSIVVCPSSLVENWHAEVKKWLGIERLRTLTVHAGTSSADASKRCDDFAYGSLWPLLIISYELVRLHSKKLVAAKAALLICDEGHRLKNCGGNKTINALLSLNCPRRIILTGTPVQNQLSEFFSLVDFVCHTALGPYNTFKRLYAEPILRSRERTATDKERELGRARAEELQRRTQPFMLRRTAEINQQFLPSRTDYVVVCRLSPLQAEMYQASLSSRVVKAMLVGTAGSASALLVVTLLRKICNHAALAFKQGCSAEHSALSEEDDESAAAPDATARPGVQLAAALHKYRQRILAGEDGSGKLSALAALLSSSFSCGDSIDRYVIVSNFTQSLDVIQALCEERGWKHARLDGATDVATRQMVVDSFNRGTGPTVAVVFLLSAKAGGAGLNLIGANRLVLFDCDWNPATDLQAMGRIWRDGQKKPVAVYRLLAAGTIEEKIFQRQILKGELASATVGMHGADAHSSSGRQFTREELRDLFTFRPDVASETSETLAKQGTHWEDVRETTDDLPLRAAVASGHVSFIHVEEKAVAALHTAAAV